MKSNFLSNLKTLTRRNLKHLFREPEPLILTIVLPIMIYLVFVILFSGVVTTESGDYYKYVLPGVLTTVVVFGLSPTAIKVNNDLKKGVTDRLCTMNISKSAILCSHVIVSMIKTIISLVILIITGYLFGLRLDFTILELFAFIAITLLLVIALSWIAIFCGIIGENAEAAASYIFIFMFLPYFSSAYVPIETMPSWLQGFAEYQPFNLIIDPLRSVLLGEGYGDKLTLCIIIWVSITVLFTYLSLRLFDKKIRN